MGNPESRVSGGEINAQLVTNQFGQVPRKRLASEAGETGKPGKPLPADPRLRRKPVHRARSEATACRTRSLSEAGILGAKGSKAGLSSTLSAWSAQSIRCT